MSAIVAERFPTIDALEAIRRGHILVDGFPVKNPASRVASTASIVHRPPQSLGGEPKLRAALAAFRVEVTDRVTADIGASTGGFTRVLLGAGAKTVYAVDAGHGQLLGSLRQDPRVKNLEGVNLGALSSALVPEPISLVTIDVSYISLARAVPQLGALDLGPGAELIALVKPMFELALDAPPPEDRLIEALLHAIRGVEAAGWRVAGATGSPVTGRGGAREMLIHAFRAHRREPQ